MGGLGQKQKLRRVERYWSEGRKQKAVKFTFYASSAHATVKLKGAFALELSSCQEKKHRKFFLATFAQIYLRNPRYSVSFLDFRKPPQMLYL